MKSVFVKQIGGCGTYLVLDMEFIYLPANSVATEPIPEFLLTFDDDVVRYFRDGHEYIRQVVDKNYDAIREKCGVLQEIKVIHVESIVVDFCREAYIGATIKWLNENLQLSLPMPVYTRDKVKRKFMVEGYSVQESM